MCIREHSASTMNSKVKWIVSGSIVTVLLLFLIWPKSVLVIEAEDHQTVYLEIESFELHWIHSIEHEEWYEVYEIQDEELVLTETYFKTFGAGVPSDSEAPPEITDDGFVKFTVNDVYPELYMNVSENVKTTIVQNDREYLLYEMFDSNTSVKVSTGTRPLFMHLTGGLI